MKPDKHKKEKNAIYKKKHGITDGSKQEHKVSEKLRDTQVKDKTRSICDGPSTDLSDKAEEETLASNSNEVHILATLHGKSNVLASKIIRQTCRTAVPKSYPLTTEYKYMERVKYLETSFKQHYVIYPHFT